MDDDTEGFAFAAHCAGASPLAASVWLLLSRLGVLGAVARRRRVGGVIAQAASTGPSRA
jgi:hypothetical protein